MPRFSIVAPLFLVATAASCSNDGGSSGGQGGAATTGGASAQGGAATTGGASAQGGAATTGGASAQGGAATTGGSVSSGGSSAGSSMGGGSTGGAMSSGGAAGSPSGGSGTTGGAAGSSSGAAGAATGGSGGGGTMTFFVTSDTSKTGKLGGLKAADARCQALAQAAGVGAKTFHAYLSAENDPDAKGPVNARDRIGKGPWYNQKGMLIAATLEALHMRTGDPDLFITEKGSKVNGQWTGSPTPNEHDILTGSKADGTVLAKGTCDSWTSEAADLKAGVGHSDGLGPGGSKAMNYPSWNASHSNGGCNDTAPAGGAGRLYCFAID